MLIPFSLANILFALLFLDTCVYLYPTFSPL